MDRSLVGTYRLQLTPDFTLVDAKKVVSTVRALGLSHLYLSPVWDARPGSQHGYDVTDPTVVRAELGGEHALRELAAAGLGLIADVVPNHMAADEEHNPFWRDPLWRASFFDVDWRSGDHRRFFDVDELAGVRQEVPEVFETTHRTVLALVREGVLDGLRIDHPDGLADPARYVERLAEAGVPHVWVEKILERDERLPAWPVEGTTGYDFLVSADGLFADPSAEEPLTRLHADVTGERRPFQEIAREARLEQARTTFSDEVRRLALLLPELSSTIDLAEALARFPVYRTYVDPATGAVSEADRHAVEQAELDPRLERILLLDERGHDAFVVRWQQTTPAIAAKGVEDTAFYRYTRLLALNEVGGDPGRFGVPVPEFHAAAADRAERFPSALLAGTTHDTKRSADVRARLLALTTLPDAWAEIVAQAHAVPQHEPIEPNDAYFVLQTLVGAWPLTTDRLGEYLRKALREAKGRTNWLAPDEEYERAVCRHALALTGDASFGPRLESFCEQLGEEARRIALGTLLLRLTAPGVPDVYRGDELPFLALVDPDNRRPVDWAAVRRAVEDPPRGSKVELIQTVLRVRRDRPAAFSGAYEPLELGSDAIGYVRGGEVATAVALRGELPALRLPGTWDDVLEVAGDRRLLVRRR